MYAPPRSFTLLASGPGQSPNQFPLLPGPDDSFPRLCLPMGDPFSPAPARGWEGKEVHESPEEHSFAPGLCFLGLVHIFASCRDRILFGPFRTMPPAPTPTNLPAPHSSSPPDTDTGFPMPLGTYAWDEGTNFALFSRDATRVWLELYDQPGDDVPAHRIELSPPEHRTGDIWHVWIEGVGPGQLYGYRVTGPYAPEEIGRAHV